MSVVRLPVPHVPHHAAKPMPLTLWDQTAECWQCGSISDLTPDPHMPDVYYCQECYTRFDRPHSFEDLGVGD